MTLSAVPVVGSDALAEREAIEVLMQDPEWLDAEFAAVMAASGILEPFGPESTVRSPIPQEDLPEDVATPLSRRSGRFLAMGTEARTRSPPAE